MKKDSYYIELEKEGYYDTVDKRSKDYREYKKWISKSDGYNSLKDNVESQSKGLGDTIAKITKATGIEKIVKLIAGDDCGCDERKGILNKKFKFKSVNCVSEEDYIYLTKFFSTKPSKVTNAQQVQLNRIHNYIFGTRKSASSCVSCVAKTVLNLKKYLQVYN